MSERSNRASGLSCPTAAELGPAFPQLDVIELLGQGGMGAVYKVRQRTLDRFAALKVLPPIVGEDPAFADRFAREARALARLNHPNIVSVYDSGSAPGPDGRPLFYFLMEFVNGPNLRALMRGGHVRGSAAVDIVSQVCDALAYAHDEGVVHRDIKPENILLDVRLRVKVADFGLAKIVAANAQSTTLTRADAVMGTPHYMAPEQHDRPLTVDRRADLYSVGVMLYEMLTGELPLGRFDPPSAKAPGLDPRLDAAVMRALENDPARRFGNATELRGALVVPGPEAPTVLAAHHATTSPSGAPNDPTRWAPTNGAVAGPLMPLPGRPLGLRLAFALACLAAGLLVGVVVWRLARPGSDRGPPPSRQAPVLPAQAGQSPTPPQPPSTPGLRSRLFEPRGLGLTVSDRAVESLSLTPAQRVAMEALLRTTAAESVLLERAHSTATRTDAGRVRVVVAAHDAEQGLLRDRFARALAELLTPAQAASLLAGPEGTAERRRNGVPTPTEEVLTPPASRHEALRAWAGSPQNRPMQDLFPRADRERTIEIWRDGERYSIQTDSPDRGSGTVTRSDESISVIPPRYRAYWLVYGPTSPDMAALLAEAGKVDDTARGPIVARAKLARIIRETRDGEARVRDLLREAGFDVPPNAEAPALAVRLEQLLRSLKGLPELSDADPAR